MNDYSTYQDCIQACLRCAVLCDHCASSCTREKDIQHLAGCIQLDIECAVICLTAARLMSLGSKEAQKLCAVCARICEACADECGQHYHKHCMDCAAACRACADACHKIAA